MEKCRYLELLLQKNVGVQRFQECGPEVRTKHVAFPESSFVFIVHAAILVLI